MPTDSDSNRASSVEEWARARLAVPELSSAVRSALEQLVAATTFERETEQDYFLSVVIRTQAKRWEQLQDALLCLAAQSDPDFEVLLMLHDVGDEQQQEMHELVRSYPADFADRVRLVLVHGGGRVRPLQASLDHARGEYLAFFDDDDLLMGNWVEAFHDGVRAAPGRMIRANVATQLNRLEIWPSGASGQRSVGVATAEYSERFNLIDHLERNHTPFMGMAFPRSFFTLWGERFDESLPVCEDWDIAIRAAGLVGLVSIPNLTAIYRRWEDAQTSYTHHASMEWVEAERYIREKVDSAPFLAPRGFIADAIEVLGRERAMEYKLGRQLNEVWQSTTWRAMAPVRKAVERIQRARRSRR